MAVRTEPASESGRYNATQEKADSSGKNRPRNDTPVLPSFSLGLFVDGAAACYCAQDFGVDVGGWRDFGQVVGENDEVGVFAGF